MNLTRPLLALLVIGLLTTGCKSLDKFDTKGDESFCGSIQTPKYAALGFSYWTDKNETLQLSLTLDSSHLGDRPGVLTSSDAKYGPCSPKPLFDGAPLRTVKAALGDQLGAMSLGEDHEEDVLAFVDSTCSGSMLAVVSLIQNGDVEVRLLRPAPDVDEPEQDKPRFGVFVLKKQQRSEGHCDF